MRIRISDRIVVLLVVALILLTVSFSMFLIQIPISTSDKEDINIFSTDDDNLNSINSDGIIPDESPKTTTRTLFDIMQSSMQPDGDVARSTPEIDDNKLIQQIVETALPLNSLAVSCMAHLNNNNTEEMIKQATIFEQKAIDAFDKTSSLQVSPETISMYNGYRNALNNYLISAATLKEGVPQSDDVRKQVFDRLVSASNMMITTYNDINFEVEYPEDVARLDPISIIEPTVEPTLEVTEAEPLVIPDAHNIGDGFEYKDSKAYNLIDVTVPRDSSKRVKSFFYVDRAKDKEVTMTAPEGMVYYAVAVTYAHGGHLVDRGTDMITPPSASAHTLCYKDVELSPITVYNALNESLNIGKLYNTESIDRGERSTMFLIYEVPEDFTKENAYLSIDLGTIWGTQSWELWNRAVE